jgi:radical SAM superfamily enzyme YgiQ (UPF0313 family)
MGLGHSIRAMFARIKECRPTHLGISMFTFRYKTVYNLIDKIKLNFPAIQIIVGGPHISTFRKDALRDCKSIDFGIVLEGEVALTRLMKGEDFRTIKGLIYRENGQIVSTGNPELIDDLDTIGFPKYEKFELDKYTAFPKLMTIVTTRGCPHQCIYCPVGLSIGRKLRYRSPEHVIEEIRYWHDRGYKIIEMMDDNFTFNMSRVHQICDLIEKEQFKTLTFNIPNGVRADKVNYHLLQRLKNVGFQLISIGVEAGNNKVLKHLKKGETIETIEQTIKWAVDIGFNVRLFFLIGSPGETYRDFKDSLEIAQKYAISGAYFYNLIPFPGTELFEWIRKNDYFIKQPDFYLNEIAHYDNIPLFETPEMNMKERKKAYREAKKVARKIYRKYVARKLSRLGAFAGMIAWVYSSRPVQTILRNSAGLRRLVFSLRMKSKM